MFDERLFEPAKSYKESLKDEFRENAEQMFEELSRKSNVDIEENRKTVAIDNDLLDKIKKLNSNVQSKNVGKVFLIIGIVLGFLAAAILIVSLFYTKQMETSYASIWIRVAIAIACVALSIVFIFITKNVKKKINAILEEKSKLEDEEKIVRDQCWTQMKALNSLFDNGMTKKLIEKTAQGIMLDDQFTISRFDYLKGKYGFSEHQNEDSSVIGVISGEVNHNTFVEYQTLDHTLGEETYYGSITIHWTETVYSNGQSHTEHRSEVLTASVTKPKPYYSIKTTMVYGNEMADELSFSRKPGHVEKLNEKEIERLVQKKKKVISKLESKALLDDDPTTNFTAMANDEFDALFGALNRDNEVQFRLMFTPLAQKSMLELLKDTSGFGDDFSFIKKGPLNYIISEHSQNWDLDDDYTRFYSHDYDTCKKNFIEYNEEYFKNLLFDLAPVLSIPTYQDQKPKEYIYQNVYRRNYTDYEAEYLINDLGMEYFEPDGANTNSILKTIFLEKKGQTDRVGVRAFAYETQDRTDYITKWGGDGRPHEVPVNWVEYTPIYKDSVVNIKKIDLTEKEFTNGEKSSNYVAKLQKIASRYTFKHGLLCCLTKDDNYCDLDKEFEKL